MKKILSCRLVLFSMLAFVVASHAATHVALPPAQYVDTDTTTNVPFAMEANGRRTFLFAKRGGRFAKRGGQLSGAHEARHVRTCPDGCAIGGGSMKFGYNWKEDGVGKIAQIVLKLFATEGKWEDYWRRRMDLNRSVVLNFKVLEVR